ncbi:GNAT family N-acetyltransferase [Vibrio sp. LaRot3]|uniref:GNAT family N-acetyltransferase n=1 Tax=Vibrio sp. LaRot3 TaxID=2998829 RepID=UPI0022CDC2C0|nr:GNAT family N-acetyltransferase [Vibrio sp. LaRot3]MDA0148472.1 GNAT family N-acetyltransferase [Vibrio sp. LaRot3]
MEISLRKAKSSDLDFLMMLRDRTMREYLIGADMPISDEAYQKRIQYHFEHAQIIEYKGKSVGLYKATYDQDTNYWYLVQLQVLPEYQGKRIGSQLLEYLIGCAQQTRSKVGLSVIKSNPAQKLYSRHGFKVVEESESEFLMRREAV